MVEILPLTWYMESPIDFEHKQYKLFAYLQNVDNSFFLRNLSPYLLHTEKMIKELINYKESYELMKKNFNKHRYIYLNENSKLIGEENHLIFEIEEIVSFSIPQLKSRVDFGYKVLEKNSQILF